MDDAKPGDPHEDREQQLRESREAWQERMAARREQQKRIADQAHEKLLAEMKGTKPEQQ